MNRVGRKYYVHPGVPVVVSSGDYGFTTAQFPAVLQTSVAVGGTTLTAAAGTPRGWSETAWSGAGSGCSAYIPKPAWQHDNHCLMRTVADVSAVADPDTGLAIYDTFATSDYTSTGWFQVGGTSLSSPLVAAMIARAGHAARYSSASSLYANQGAFTDVVGGSNGYCGKDYLCTGKPGYDAPTGLGTPNGLGGL
jgi:subtilase family serine protease